MTKYEVIGSLAIVFTTVVSPMANAGEEDNSEKRAAGAWATLQEATDPDIVAIRKVLEVLIQDRRPSVVTVAPRSSDQASSEVRSLESRIRRLESEVQYLRSRVDRLR